MTMHQELTRIAAERSPEKRLELLHKVTDLYFEGFGKHSASESYLFNDIMEKIVELFSRDLKRQVSASLAVLCRTSPPASSRISPRTKTSRSRGRCCAMRFR